MLVHSVYFKLRKDLTDGMRSEFLEGLRSLRDVPVARAAHVGVPAETAKRPVVRRDYDFGLTVVLDDVASHDVYQAHPVHKAFVEQFADFWEGLEVFDCEGD